MPIRPFHSHTARGLSPCVPPSSIAARICLFLAVLLVLAGSANAQLQQPFVYTTGGAIATRNDATGVLAPTSASPLAVLGFPAVLDAKGRFIFARGNNSIHMYQVDSVTGSYTEVPGSPFALANTNSPTLIATEPTGANLAVVNSIGLNPGGGAGTNAPAAQKSSIVTPSGTSTLVITPTATNASGKVCKCRRFS
jgi:hypothetical protein